MFGMGVSAYFFGHPMVSVTILIATAISVLLGVLLWTNRHRIDPYPALQILIGILGACTLLIFLLFDVADIPFAYKFGERQSAEAGFSYYWCLFIFPVILLQFHMIERGGKK